MAARQIHWAQPGRLLIYLNVLGINSFMARRDVNFMNGVPELLILQHLARKEMYGYELVGAIRKSTDSVLDLAEGCVYPTLHALESGGFLTSRRAEKDGRIRLYYRVTAKGNARLKDVSENWRRIADAIEAVLGAHDANLEPA